MCEHAETFCKKTLTGLAHWLHLKVRMRAGLFIFGCYLMVIIAFVLVLFSIDCALD